MEPTPQPSPQPTTEPSSTAGPTIEPTIEPTDSPEPTVTPQAQRVSLEGPACPDGFPEQRGQTVNESVEMTVGGTLSLTLGSTPSVPCGWQELEVSDETILRLVEHRTEWPAEGATPMPGAPGVEVWVLRAEEPGEGVVSLECTCLGEEGAGQELVGTFALDVSVQ